MARNDEIRLMTKVARMYYSQSIRQTEITERLNIHQSTVSRLLKKAQQAGIVRISVTVPNGIHAELEEALESRFDLKEAIVVDSVSNNEDQIALALEELKTAVPEIGILIGYPEYSQGYIYNSACLMRGGQILARHRKSCLPNYKVFDEKRYFRPGSEPVIVDLKGIRSALLICEDVWESPPACATPHCHARRR